MTCTLLFERLSTTCGGNPSDGTTVTGGVWVGVAACADAAATSSSASAATTPAVPRGPLPDRIERGRYRRPPQSAPISCEAPRVDTVADVRLEPSGSRARVALVALLSLLVCGLALVADRTVSGDVYL